ncbi:MAG: hypothetical protein EKK41_00165 [Hyphomicrobiales bacterium]|nr:MAG: hypothetical protein EKK41_00165 [Hyphomicrobiales bacterium]
MGRPRKDEPRDQQHNIRFTAAEIVRIQQNAARSGKTLLEFSRTALLRRPRPPRGKNAPTLIVFSAPVIAAWQQLGAQLNDIAHRMNARDVLPPSELRRILAELQRLLRSGLRHYRDHARYALAPPVRFHLRKVGANLVQLRQRHDDLGLPAPAALLRLLEAIRAIMRGDRSPDAA